MGIGSVVDDLQLQVFRINLFVLGQDERCLVGQSEGFLGLGLGLGIQPGSGFIWK